VGSEKNLVAVLRESTAHEHISANFKIAFLIIQATSAQFEVKLKAFTIQFIKKTCSGSIE
jgi:hypothetical protein